jgi:hypothetical protein
MHRVDLGWTVGRREGCAINSLDSPRYSRRPEAFTQTYILANNIIRQLRGADKGLSGRSGEHPSGAFGHLVDE